MKFDPDSTVPLPAGSFVTHFGKLVHYDGAKDEEAVLIVGEGPATATPTEAKGRQGTGAGNTGGFFTVGWIDDRGK